MRALTVAELLAAWERAYPERPAQRALTLLALAAADEGVDVGALPVGERDARLLTLREATFGGSITSVATCEACGEKMELALSTRDVRAPAVEPPGPRVLEVEGCRVTWRLPTAADVAELDPSMGLERARAVLEERCVVSASRCDEEVAPGVLLPAVRAAIARAVAEADPQADVELTMGCPSCQKESLVPFDVTTFFWDELNAWAQQTLREVHELASAYGWSERDILGMTAFRRQAYLEMLGA